MLWSQSAVPMEKIEGLVFKCKICLPLQLWLLILQQPARSYCAELQKGGGQPPQGRGLYGLLFGLHCTMNKGHSWIGTVLTVARNGDVYSFLPPGMFTSNGCTFVPRRGSAMGIQNCIHCTAALPTTCSIHLALAQLLLLVPFTMFSCCCEIQIHDFPFVSLSFYRQPSTDFRMG